MSGQCFPSNSANSKSIKIKLDLSNYAIKTDLKNLNADTSSFALKTNLADLKTKVDKIDFGKINNIDDHEVKNYIEQNYLFFEPSQGISILKLLLMLMGQMFCLGNQKDCLTKTLLSLCY